MNVGKEFERIERSLPRGGRFTVSQRYGRECRVSVGGRYCCRCGIRCTCGFSPPIHLQQSKKEGVVFPNRPAHIAARLVDDVTGRFLEPCTLVGQTQRFHPIAPVVFPRFSVVEICSGFGHRRKLSAARSAEFGRVSNGLQLDLLNRLRNDSQRAIGDSEIVIIDAIQHEVVVTGALPVRGEFGEARGTSDQGGEQSQTRNVPDIVINLHRQFVNLALGECPFDRSRSLCQLTARCFKDGDFGSDGRGCQRLIDDDLLCCFHGKVVDFMRFETGSPELHRIVSRVDGHEPVKPHIVRECFT